MRKIMRFSVAAVAAILTGCATSPFLNEDAAKRMAAVDALAEQRQLAEVALDYCTEPYQELPTGCKMDVRIRAVERLTDQDLLMAVASFSIVKAKVQGRTCMVTLAEANPELRKLALGKLTESNYIKSVLSAKDPFAIEPLFGKALFGYYKIAGTTPATARSAWLAAAKGKESAVAKAFCESVAADGATLELCRAIYALLPAAQSAETQASIKAAFKRGVDGVYSVRSAVRVLNLAEVVPETAVVKEDVDAMCKKVSGRVATISEFTAFGALVNGDAKKYLADPDSLIKEAATLVVPKLNGMKELAAFADVLKTSTSPWIGQIGIEDAVRKCAGDVSDVGAIKVFASQMASFNDVMLPNKTDIAGDAVIAVLKTVVEGRAGSARQSSDKKAKIEEFVKAVTEFDGSLLSDKAIVAIFENAGIESAYTRALRADGFREDMGNELAGAAMKSGSFGDLLVAGMIMGAMGDKESPKFTKMFAHLAEIIRTQAAFVAAAKAAKIYYSRNSVVEAAERRMDDMTQAKVLLAVFENFPDSSWCVDKTLSIGARMVRESKEDAIALLQPVFRSYANSRKCLVSLLACGCLTDIDMIKEKMTQVAFDDLGKEDIRLAYMAAMTQARKLCERSGSAESWSSVLEALCGSIEKGLSRSCEYLKAPFEFKRDAKAVMDSIGKENPQLWAMTMLRVKLPPYSVEFNRVHDVLSVQPSVLIDFLVRYECEPYQEIGPMKEGEPISKLKIEYQRTHARVYYYDCDWYPKALCSAAELELCAADRAKLDARLSFVAINGIEIETRNVALAAIHDEQVKASVVAAWAKADADISKNATELLAFSLDDSLSKMKRQHVWDTKYAFKRMRLRGKVVDVNEATVLVEGGSDITDYTNVVPPPTEEELREQRNDLQSAQRDTEWVEREISSAKRDLETKELNLMGNPSKREMKEALDEFHKRAREQLAAAEKKLAALKAKTDVEKIKSRFELDGVKVQVYYSVVLPKEMAESIGSLSKGDEVVFEGYPSRIYRGDPRDRYSSGKHDGRYRPKDKVYTFHGSFSQARIVPIK